MSALSVPTSPALSSAANSLSLRNALLDIQHDTLNHRRLHPNLASRNARRRHLRRQQLVRTGSRNELHKPEHSFAVVTRPLGPRVGGESLAGESELAVQVEVKSLVDRLAPVGHGHVLEAFLEVERELAVGVVGGDIGG